MREARFGWCRLLVASIAMSAQLGCGGGDEGGNDPAPAVRPAIQGFSADRSHYFVGDRAQLTAVFSNGSGRIEPGNVTVTSGQSITTPALTKGVEYRLVVTDGITSVSRDLVIDVRYRERTRFVAAPFARAEHAAVRLADGRVAIIGGSDASYTFPTSIHVFDPDTENFGHFGDLASGRIGFTATLLDNGDILVAGGLTTLAAAPAAEIIDGSGATRATPGMPVARRMFAAAALLPDGRVLFSGGSVGRPVATLETYDPASGTFSALAGSLAFARYDHSMVLLGDDKVLIHGGVNDDLAVPPEIFDLATLTSTVLAAPEARGRYLHAAQTLADGSIIMLGGEDYDGLPLTSVSRFDPATSTFRAMLDLAMPRSSAAAASLGDGRVLISGGGTAHESGAVTVTDTTELIALPARRDDGPSLSLPRYYHTATPLLNGKLLIFGGMDGHQQPLASADIFE